MRVPVARSRDQLRAASGPRIPSAHPLVVVHGSRMTSSRHIPVTLAHPRLVMGVERRCVAGEADHRPKRSLKAMSDRAELRVATPISRSSCARVWRPWKRSRAQPAIAYHEDLRAAEQPRTGATRSHSSRLGLERALVEVHVFRSSGAASGSSASPTPSHVTMSPVETPIVQNPFSNSPAKFWP